MSEVQKYLDEFRKKVLSEAKRNLRKQKTSGDLSRSLKSKVKESKNSIEIILLIEGSIICNNVLISKGESILLPAMLGKFQVTSKGKSVLFRVKVPN